MPTFSSGQVPSARDLIGSSYQLETLARMIRTILLMTLLKLQTSLVVPRLILGKRRIKTLWNPDYKIPRTLWHYTECATVHRKLWFLLTARSAATCLACFGVWEQSRGVGEATLEQRLWAGRILGCRHPSARVSYGLAASCNTINTWNYYQLSQNYVTPCNIMSGFMLELVVLP